MFIAQLGAVAALASLSRGFLIPPEISSADTDVIKTLPFEDAVGMEGRVMEINCPGCPVLTAFNDKTSSVQAESILQLNFSLSHQDGPDKLLLNGVQIYPVDPTSQSFMEPLTASQMIKGADDTWQYASNPKLGYSLAIGRQATSPQDQLDLLAVHLEIVEVADKFIKGLPTVDLQILETPSGKLMLGNSGITAPANLSNPTDDDRECTTLLCKWRVIVADRLAALKKGCGSKRPSPEVRPVFVPKPHHSKHPHNKHPGHGRPRPHGSHRPWRHHHRHGSLSRFIRGIVFHVLVPVLIGVMVGITASLIGMVVGHIVVFTWRMLFRRGQNKTRYAEVMQEEADEESEDESKGFLEAQGPPPQYEDAVVEKKDAE
ncbi:hypothetical protein ONS95_004515 [Cadophora gregata]|uniref:uncharacterized protein n=1 Tax=Cadophora gregata TaxID=51156 RepID=UPI0026DB2F3E|nr:uncharacterized protein ONS95_004515 [Cadophora gregata]KAK0105123.1 hypothetical protein ONS96_004525 [Cadophora gregata f. sp. sojae]KAK0106008.1 hypothetical protein ONS95_004515 [Cadophora gregata]